jgi:protein ImuA
MDSRKAKEIDALRVQIARLQTTDAANRRLTTLKVGLPAIDDLLPGHGLQSALHEAAGGDAEMERGAAAALFLAGILARQKGIILWMPWIVEACDAQGHLRLVSDCQFPLNE